MTTLNQALEAAKNADMEAKAAYAQVAGQMSPEAVRAGRNSLISGTKLHILELAKNLSIEDAVNECMRLITARADNVTVRHVLMTRREAAQEVRRLLLSLEEAQAVSAASNNMMV